MSMASYQSKTDTFIKQQKELMLQNLDWILGSEPGAQTGASLYTFTSVSGLLWRLLQAGQEGKSGRALGRGWDPLPDWCVTLEL